MKLGTPLWWLAAFVVTTTASAQPDDSPAVAPPPQPSPALPSPAVGQPAQPRVAPPQPYAYPPPAQPYPPHGYPRQPQPYPPQPYPPQPYPPQGYPPQPHPYPPQPYPPAYPGHPHPADGPRQPWLYPAQPGAYPWTPPPAEYPYEEGDTIPDGYEVRERYRRRLIIGGASTFGGCYLASVLAATVTSNSNDDFTPMYAPLVGPFIAMDTTSAGTGGSVLLLLDGLGQVVGVGLFASGFLYPEKVAMRKPVVGSIDVEPVVGPGHLGLRGSF